MLEIRKVPQKLKSDSRRRKGTSVSLYRFVRGSVQSFWGRTGIIGMDTSLILFFLTYFHIWEVGTWAK